MIAAPMFHSWGYAHFTLALPLASTLVLRRRFDPEETLRAFARHRRRAGGRAGDAAADPGARPETIARYDTERAAGRSRVSGSALPGELATRVMDTFGDVLYNLYGSTEVALGDDRHAGGPARRARHRRAPAAGHARAAARRARARVARRATRADLRRQRDGLRRLHRRRRQGDRRRADEHRRRRPLRRRRPPVRRRARRRHDRLAAARTCSRARSRTCSPTTRRSTRPP